MITVQFCHPATLNAFVDEIDGRDTRSGEVHVHCKTANVAVYFCLLCVCFSRQLYEDIQPAIFDIPFERFMYIS